MFTNVESIAKCLPDALGQPVAFGKHVGKYIWQIPVDYWVYLAKANGYPIDEFLAKIALARQFENYRSNINKKSPRPVFTERLKETDFYKTLWSHQKNLVEFYSRMEYLGIFFDIGVGKTLALLALLRVIWRKNPPDSCLVICPKSVFNVWEKEIEKYTNFTYITLTGTMEKRISYLGLKRDFYITNYEALLSDDFLTAIYQKPLTICALDEVQKIKNYQAQRTKAILQLGTKFTHRYALTGTPFGNNMSEIWPIATFLDKGKAFGLRFAKFRDKYFFPNYEGKLELRQELSDEFHDKMKQFSVVVKKRDVLDLPPKLFVNREIELTGDIKESYTTARRDLMLVINDIETPIRNKLALTIRLRQITGGGVNEERFKQQPKMELLADLLSDSSIFPVVVVAVFVPEIMAILKFCKDNGLRAAAICSKFSKQTPANIESFMAGKLDVIVIQPTSGGSGINLQISSNMVLYSINHSAIDADQVPGRIERGGQKNKMTFFSLLAKCNGKNTIDHIVKDAVEKKGFAIEEFLRRIKKEGI